MRAAAVGSPVRPLVSVVILSHRKGMAPEAFASAANQTVSDIEVRVAYSPLNWPAKLNDAVKTTAGEWVVLLCDDDVLDPRFIEECLLHAEHGDLIYTDRRIWATGMDPFTAPVARYHSNNAPGGIYGVKMSPEWFVFGSSLPMTCLIRRTLWDKLHGYDCELPHADTEFFLRAVQAGARLIYVAEPLFCYRLHPEQQSRLDDTGPAALREIHRKHYKKFGMTVAEHPDEHGMYQCRMVPPLRKRLAAKLLLLIEWARTPIELVPPEDDHVRL